MPVLNANSIVLLLVLVLSSLQHGADSLGIPFDYYQLVMRWPRAVCTSEYDWASPCRIKKDHQPLRFTLNGMWPTNWTNNPSSEGIDCRDVGTAFQRDEMIKQKNLQEQLTQSWPGLHYILTGMELWEYEYNHHGRCSQGTINQTAYFSRAHKLWQEYHSVYEAFADEKIVPAAGKTYRYTQFEQAIGKRFGSDWKVVIFCRTVHLTPSGGNKTSLLLLHEIIFCFDNQAMEKKSCNRQSNCPNAKQITFIN